MVKSTIQPKSINIIYKDNIAHIHLTKNVNEIVDVNPFTKAESTIYEYDEVVATMKNRNGLEEYVESNFDVIWNLGEKQKQIKLDVENKKNEIEKLINEYRQVDVNEQLESEVMDVLFGLTDIFQMYLQIAEENEILKQEKRVLEDELLANMLALIEIDMRLLALEGVN